jgi:hypothetical protein
MPLWPDLIRHRPRLRRNASGACNRTANPIAQSEIGLSTARYPPKIRAESCQSHASAQLSPHAHRPQIPIAPAALSVPNTPRFRALALFGRRPHQRVDRPSSRRPKTCTTHPNAHSAMGRPVYLARFQVVVAGPPTDALALVYFSSSWLKVTRDRFCSVPFQLGNVAVSSLKVMILSATLME